VYNVDSKGKGEYAMQIEPFKYITNFVNVHLIPLQLELRGIISSYGVWQEEVYKWSKQNIISDPLDNFLIDFREEVLHNYQIMDEVDIVKETEKLCNFCCTSIMNRVPQKEMSILYRLNCLCSDLSELNKKERFTLNIVAKDKNGKTLKNVLIRLSENKGNKTIFEGQTEKNQPLKLDLPPKVYFLNARRRYFIFFKREQFKILPIFSDRNIELINL